MKLEKGMKALFATLVMDDGKTASDDMFLENLARWILDNTQNVNVAQRLNIIAIKLQDEIRKSWNIK